MRFQVTKFLYFFFLFRYFFRKTTLFCFCCTLSFFILPKTLFAQIDLLEAPEIQVDSNNHSSTETKVTAFATVIYPEDYHEQVLTLPDLLSQQTGIFVKGFGGLGKLSTVTIRGSTAEQVSVYLDGIKLNTGQGGAFDFSSLPLSAIEKVEVIRGGASSRFGSDAIGGVINIITKKATQSQKINAKLSLGSFLTVEEQFGFSKSWDKIGLSFQQSHLSSQGDFNFDATRINFSEENNIGGGKGFERLQNSFWSESFLGRLDYKFSSTKHLSLTNDFFYSFREKPGTEIETTQLYPKNPLEAHEKLLRNSIGLNWRWTDFQVKNLQWTLTPTYNLERSHFSDPSPALGNPIDVRYNNHHVGVKSRWLYEKTWSSQRHLFDFLYHYQWQGFNSDSNLPSSLSFKEHHRHSHAVYFGDTATFFDEKLVINPSLRWEQANDFGSNIAWHVGVTVKPWTWLKIKSNVGTSFRYPNFNELYFPDQGFIRGNPNLKKEEVFNFDAGLSVDWQWGFAELSYFRNDIDNSIIFVPVSVFTIAPLNTEAVLAQGLEFSLLLKPLDFLEISGNYTFLNAEFKGTNRQLPGRPRHLANAQIRLYNDLGSVFTRMQYIDALAIDFPNTRWIRSRALVDVGASVYFKKNYFFSLEAKNIGNVQTSDSVGFPLPKLSVFATLGYKS